MKKIAVCALLAVALIAAVFVFGTAETGAVGQGEYLRIHIRANSNGKEDQAVKYLVRDAVVEYLTPVVAECGTKEAAMAALNGALDGAALAAERVLEANGFSYGARASVRREEFPTRVYDGVTLSAGVYDALIVELGTGEGDNWWCVVYPPLCFTSGGGNVVYRSKIAEIIRNFFA